MDFFEEDYQKIGCAITSIDFDARDGDLLGAVIVIGLVETYTEFIGVAGRDEVDGFIRGNVCRG